MPSPSEPRTEQLIDAIVARLGAITAGATYWYTPGEVARDWKNYSEITGFPFYGVIDGEQHGDELTNMEIQETFTVIIVGWIKDTTDRRQAVRRAIADVMKAVHSDDTWGDLALRTLAPFSTTDQSALVAKPYGYFELSVPIVYDRVRTAV